MKRIQFILTVFAGIFLAQGLHAQSPVVLEKTIADNGDGTYSLTLKSYLTGKIYDSSSALPTDIVLAMDVSKDLSAKISTENLYAPVAKAITPANMAVTKYSKTPTTTTKNKATATAKNPTKVTRAMTKLDRTTVTTQDWTYKKVAYGNAAGTSNYSKYYRDDNGDYYVVHRANNLTNTSTGAANVRAIWYVDKNNNTWYLTTDGVSATYKNVTSDTGKLWTGTLYTGWTYLTHSTKTTNSDGSTTTTYQCYGFHYGNANATHADQRYYKHTDGEYYPVRLRNDMPDSNGGNNCRVAYVIIDGVTYYLHGERLDSDPEGYDHSMTSDYRAIYFAPLYYSKNDGGGWWYDNIVAATSSGGHYYLYTDGVYYPVKKGSVEVAGTTYPYQAYIETDNDGRRYLYGTNHLSATPCPFETANNIPMFFGDLYTGGWCTNNITDGTTGTAHYYLHSDGEYYPVREIAETNNHQAYIETLNGRYYFNGRGLSDTPDTPYTLSTSKYVALYFGTFYTMTGWTYATVTAATAESGHFYLYDNNYYPVLKETLTSPTTTYQIYTMLPGADGNLTVKKYIWGHGLHDDACPYSAATTTVLYCGKLYSGGWTQANITLATSEKSGHFFLYEDGEYYPLKKKTVTVNVNGVDKTTYQVIINLPDGTTRYIWGNAAHLDPYPYSWATKATLYFGNYYAGGWTYNSIIAQATAGGEFYKHTDGKYYRVLRQTKTVNSVDYYQLYVELDGVGGTKYYLQGHTVSTEYYKYATQKTMGIYYGTLYRGGWTYSNVTAGSATAGQFALYNNKYFPIKKGKDESPWCIYIDKTLDGEWAAGKDVKVYLNGSNFYTTKAPYYKNKKSSLWLETLYQLKAYSKAVGLQEAVKGFYEEMTTKSQQTNRQHRLALLQYGLEAWGATGGNAGYDYPHLRCTTSALAVRKAAMLADFYDLTNNSDLTALHNVWEKATLTSATSDTKTAHRFGLSIARGLFLREGGNDNVDYDGSGSVEAAYEVAKLTGDARTNYASRPKIVIIIGDGVERVANETNLNAAISQANLIKQDPNAKIYYVHVGKLADRTPEVAAFEQSISSGEQYCYQADFYDESLTNVLLAISQQIGGADLHLGEDTIVQDVLTPEFIVNPNQDIQVLTSDYGTVEGSTVPQFSPEEAWAVFEEANVTQTSNADGSTTIQVTGFDFTDNIVGEDVTGGGYSGKQLILRIPIIPKDGIVGGNHIPTNTADSKFMDANQNVYGYYAIQYVDGVPIDITISKTGLRVGESAVFTIKRKLWGAANYDSTPFMRLILTGNAQGTAVTAELKKLDPAYSYLIEEGTWSWTYTPTVSSISTEQQSQNPFEFGNTPRTDITYDYGEREVNLLF